MKWNDHSDIAEEHAFLSPSNYHWTNYDIPKLVSVYENYSLKEAGTLMHSFAELAIKNKYKMSRAKKTLNLYVNDCIGFDMTPEVTLFYSNNAFGKADAVSFKNNILRIFDFKSGLTKASFKQLDVYSAFFCLEYSIDPREITIQERIYQNNGYEEVYPNPDYILDIMNLVVEFDKVIESLKEEETM